LPQVADLKEITFATQGWQGGLNVRDSLAQIAPNELRRAENVTYDAAGGVSKRPGTISRGTFGNPGDRIISMYTYYRAMTPPQVLIHTSAGTMLYTNDPTATPIVWATVTTGLSGTASASFETQNSKCYFAEGTRVGQWDGAAYTTISAAPSGINFLRVWKDTMWAAGITNPDRVYSSAAGDPTSWPAANYVDIMHGDGDYISGLASDGLYLIVPKHRRIQVITDPALFVNRTADWEKGAESHFGWIHLEDKLYFLSRLGVCWWQGDSSAKLISYKIDPFFQPEVLNLGVLWRSYGYTIGSKCGWAVAETAFNFPTMILEYYPRLGPIYQISGSIGPGPWTIHRLPATTFTTVRTGSTEVLLGGHPTDNKVMEVFADAATDDGQPFVGTIEGAPINISTPIFTKYLRRMHAVGAGQFYIQLKRNYEGGVYVTVPVNFASSGIYWDDGVWNVGNWGEDPPVREAIFNLDAFVQVVSVCITDADVDLGRSLLPVGTKDVTVTAGSWALYQITFDATQLGLRGT
jgi:hypothetical protein